MKINPYVYAMIRFCIILLGFYLFIKVVGDSERKNNNKK